MFARSAVGLFCVLAIASVWQNPGSTLGDPAAGEERLDGAVERGWAKFRERDFAGALAEFSSAIALRPTDASLRVPRAWMHLLQRDYDKALDDLDEALRLDPKSHVAHVARCAVWMETGGADKAVADAAKAVELKPDDAFSHAARAYARAMADDFEGAIADAGRALALEPNEIMALTARGKARLAQGDRQGGLADHDAAVKANSTNVEPWFWRGVAHYDLRNWKEALADFRCANAIGGREWSLLRTWVVRARLGERDAAAEELRAGLTGRKVECPLFPSRCRCPMSARRTREETEMKMCAGIAMVAVIVTVAPRMSWAGEGKEVAPPKAREAEPNMKRLERRDFGFRISYPEDWCVEYPNKGVEILPKSNPHFFDPDLGREVANPGVNITVAELPDDKEDYVSKFIEVRRRGYKGYAAVKHLPCKVNGSPNAKAYEFRYDVGTVKFAVLSLVAQKGTKLFTVTASGRADDFEKARQAIAGIVFSFCLLD